MMRGLELVRNLEMMEGVNRRSLRPTMGSPLFPAREGPVLYEVKDVLIAQGVSDVSVELVVENINDMMAMLSEDPGLGEFFDEKIFRRLSELGMG